MSLEAELREYFGENKKRVVLVGVGNPMRADDGIGPKIIELLQENPLDHVLLINSETVPESFTSKVTGFEPSHVLLIDAANFRGEVGDTKMITSAQIGGQAVSTHSLPLTIFISVIEHDLDLNVMLLGIQPRTIDFYAPMSPDIEEKASLIANTLYQVLSE